MTDQLVKTLKAANGPPKHTASNGKTASKSGNPVINPALLTPSQITDGDFAAPSSSVAPASSTQKTSQAGTQVTDLTSAIQTELDLIRDGSASGDVVLNLGDVSLGGVLTLKNLTATFSVTYADGAFSGSVQITADSASLKLGSAVTSTIENISGSYAFPSQTFALTFGSFDVTVSSFVSFHADSGSISYDPNASTSVTLTNGTSLTTKNVSVLTIGMTGVSLFAGVNGPADSGNATGIQLSGADFALALFKPVASSDSSVYYAFETSGGTITPLGLPSSISVSGSDLSVQINGSTDNGRVVDFTKFDDGKYTVSTGPDTSEDFAFNQSLVAVAGSLTLDVGDFIHLTGSFGFTKSGDEVTIDVGHTAFDGATDVTFALGPTDSPYFSATASLSMQFDRDSFTINSASVTVNTALRIGSILEVDTFSVSLAHVTIDRATGQITGAVDSEGNVQDPLLTITAASASLFPDGGTISAAITATEGDGADGLGLKAVFNLQTSAFSITVEHLHLTVGSVLTADADNIAITYDPTSTDPHQQLVQIESATVDFPRFEVTGSINNLVIYADGFHFDSVTLAGTSDDPITLGILTITKPSVTLTDFGVTFGDSVSFDASGTLTVAAESASLAFSSGSFTASATGLSISVSLDPATFGNVNAKADTLTIQIKSLITLHATEITVNTNPDAGDPYLSVASATINLTLGGLSLTGSASDFAIINGDSGAEFQAGDNFSVTVSATASNLNLPSWIGFDIQKLELKWDDFAGHPETPKIYLTASITSIHGLPDGVSVSGYVRDAVIDIGALENGDFPITGIGSAGGSVKGKLFGMDLDASFVLGVVKFNAEGGVVNDDGSVINADGTTTASGGDTTVTGSTFYAGVSGGATIEGLGGVQIYVGFSKLGPLTFYIDATFPLLLDPDTGLAIGGFSAGVSFNDSIAAPNQPTDLRRITANLNPENLTIEQWGDKLRLQTVAQYRASDGGQDLSAAYNQPMVIQGGVTFYDAYLSEDAFKITGNIAIGINPADPKKVTILLSGTATFGDSISFKAYFYAAIDGNPGAVTPFSTMFLLDEPADTPIESIGGSLSFTFTDSNGNPLTPSVTHNSDGSFSAADQAGGFQIGITGFVQYSAAGTLSLSIQGQVTLTVTTTFARLDLGGSVNISYLGDVATAQGELVVDYSEPGTPKFYGALTLATGPAMAKLENVGLHVDGAVTFEFNSTGQQQTVNIPGVHPGDPSTAVTISGDTIFDMIVSGTSGAGSYATISYETGGQTIFEMEAVFDLKITASGLQIFANLNRLTIGPIDNPLMTFHGYALLVVDDTGFAAELTLQLSSQLYSDLSFNASFTMVLNTTSHDVAYTIPDDLPAVTVYDASGNPTGSTRSLTIPRGPPQGLPQDDGSFASYGATGPYLVIVGNGDLTITLDPASLSFHGFFRFELSSSSDTGLQISMVVQMTCTTDGIPGLSGLEVEGAFQFNNQGVVALLDIGASGGTGGDHHDYGNGVTLDAEFELGINTTPSDVSQIGGITLADNDGNPITIQAGHYLIAASGTLTLSVGGVGFSISGSIFITGDDTSGTITVSGTLTATVEGAKLLSAQADGVLVYNSSGVAGKLVITMSGGTNNPLTGTGFSFDGTFSLVLNTTSAPQNGLPFGSGTTDISAGPAGSTTGAPYVEVEASGTMTFGSGGNAFLLKNADLFLSISTNGLLVSGSADLTLEVGGTDLFSIQAQAAMSVTSAGFAAKLSVEASITDSSHYYLGGTFILLVNTTGADQQVGSVIIPGAAEGLSAGPYFEMEVLNTDMMLGTGSSSTSTGFDLNGSFYLTISSSGLAITASASLKLNVAGQTLFSFDADAAFLISSSGIAGQASLSISAGGSGGNFGFNANAMFVLEMNFTGAPVTKIGNRTVSLPQGPYLRVSVTATLTLAGILDVNGAFTLTIDSSSLVIHLNATLRAFGITFGVTGDAGIYWLGSNTGIALNLALSLGGNSSNPEATLIPGVLAVQGQFLLQINTTGATHFGISGDTVLKIQVSNVNVYVFGFKMISGSLTITVGTNAYFRCSGSLDFDFFGFGDVTVTFDFDSKGKYTFDGSLYVQLGSDSFNIHGTLAVHFSNETGPNFELRVDGGVTAFHHTFASVGADVQINGSSVDISAYVSVDLGLFSVGGTVHIHLGSLTPMPAPPPPPALARVDSGILYLNLSTDATTYRGVGPLTDEYYSITLAGGSAGHWNLYVSAPGVYTGAGVYPNGASAAGAPNDVVEYDDISQIVVNNTGTSNTTINIDEAVTASVTIHAGTGTNQFFMGGGSSTITGSSGTDKVIGGNGAVTFHAGTGKSTFIGGAANNSVYGSTNVTILESGYSNYTLTDSLLTYDGHSDALNGVFTITLTAPSTGVTTFTVSNYSHTVTLTGNSTSSATVTLDGDLTLNGNVLQESNGGVITFSSVQALTLNGGGSANTFTINSWAGGGLITLDGGDGADLYKINLQGAGSQTVDVADSGTSGLDALIVTGTGAADTLNLTAGAVARASETVNYTGIESLTVNTLGGSDTVNINNPTATLLVNGGTGMDTFNVTAIQNDATLVLGAGTDTVNVGSMAPATSGGTLNNINAVLSVQGAIGGTTRLNLDDSADSSDSVANLTATSLTGIFGASGSLQYSNISTFSLAMGSGGDTLTVVGNGSGVTNITTGSQNDVLNVQGLSGKLNVNLGGGMNTVNIGSNAPGTGGTLARLTGIINLTGSGNDVMNVDDSGSNVAETGTLTANSLTFLDPVTINFTGFAQMNISLSQAGDLFAVVDTFTSASATPVIVLDGNGGDDIFSVLDTHAVMTINGDDGNDSMYVFGNSSVLNLFGNNGDDSFYIFASVLPGSQNTANVDGGAADSNGNQYYSYRINASVNINGGAGNDKVFIFGTVLNDVITIDGTHVTGAGIDVTFTECEQLVVAGMGGDDTFYIENVTIDTTVMGEGSLPVFPPGVTPPDLTGGAPPATSFNDTFYVGWQGRFIPGSLAGINATLTLEGDDGVDTAYIDNSADTFNRTFTLGATTLDSDAMGPNGHIVYDSTVDNLNIQSGAGGDTFVVNGTGAGLQTTLWGGAGNDSFTVNAPLTTPLAINGDANTFNGDTLTVYGSGLGNNFVITGFTVDGAGATISYGTVELLTINGVSGANSFTLNGDSIPTYLNGGSDSDVFTVNANSVPAFLSGGAGADTFTINGNSGPLTINGDGDNDVFTINGSSAALSISGGDGNDAFVVNSLSSPASLDGAAGDDSVIVNAPLSASLTVTGGAGGNDSLTVNGTAGNDFWVITSSAVSGVGAPVSYDSIDLLTVNGLAGDDTFNVRSTGNATTVAGGPGSNVFNVGSLAPVGGGTLDAIQGVVTIQGAASDILNIDETGAAAGQSGFLSDSALTGFGMAGINYQGVGILNLALGSLGDSLDVTNTSAGAITNVNGNSGADIFNIEATTGVLNINGGAGNDSFNLGGLVSHTVNAIAGQVNVVGGGDSDTLNLDDTGDATANIGVLTALSINGLGLGAGVTYQGIGNLNIDLGSGFDSFYVRSTNSGTITLLSTGAGSNTIYVGIAAEDDLGMLDGIQGPLQILGSGTDTLNIFDTGSAISKSGTFTPTTLTGLGMGPAGITFTGLRWMNIALGTGNDQFAIHELTNSIITTVDGGAGMNTVTLVFSGNFAAENLTLLNFATGTLVVGGDFTGLLNDDGGFASVNIEGSLSETGVLNAGSIDSMTIGGDLAGRLNVDGLLNALTVLGGTPGIIIAGDINLITVQAGFGSKVLQVIEGGVERQIQALPVDGGEMPDSVLFAFTYDSTGTSPALTIHISNDLDAQFDLALVVHSVSAKFNLALLDAHGPSGIANISVEGDILGGSGGVFLPSDNIVGVEVRDALPAGSIHVAGIEGLAFGSLILAHGKTIRPPGQINRSLASIILGPTTLLLDPTGVFRVPFGELHSVGLFVTSGDHQRLISAGLLTDQIADDAGITALVQIASISHNVVITIGELDFIGDGGSLRTGASVNSITSTGPLGDIYITGIGGLGSITAPSIFGSVTVTRGIIFGTIQTTGIRIDPITGEETEVNADIGRLVSGKSNKVKATTISARELSGQIISRGNLISTIKLRSMASGSTISAQGDIGALQRNSLGAPVHKSGKIVRLGGITVSGNVSGSIIALGNIIADVRITGSFTGQIAASGASIDGLGEDQIGILGNLKISKFSTGASVISGGEIGDVSYKTTLSGGKAQGLVAAIGSVNLTHSTKLASSNFYQNTGTNDPAGAQAIARVFTDGSSPLLFDEAAGDLQGLAQIQANLASLDLGDLGNSDDFGSSGTVITRYLPPSSSILPPTVVLTDPT